MIQQDRISIGFTVLAASALMFLGTFGPDLLLRSLFSFSLLIGGLFLSILVGKYKNDSQIDAVEQKQFFQWVGIAVGVIALVSLVVPRIPLSIDTSKLSITDAFVVPKMFAVLIAVSEEQFFRAFATNFFVGRMGVGMGVVLSGIFFGLYHTAVYGTNMNLMLYVMSAGVVMSYIAVKTQRVSTTMTAHVIINLLSGA